MLWIVDACTEVDAQRGALPIINRFLKDHLKRGGTLVLSNRIVTEMLQCESRGLLDYSVSYAAEFDRKKLAVRFSPKEIQTNDPLTYAALKRLKERVLSRLGEDCRNEVEKDWHLIAPAIVFNAPVLTEDAALLKDCVCPLGEGEDELGQVCWVLAKAFKSSKALLAVASSADLRPIHTIVAHCDQ